MQRSRLLPSASSVSSRLPPKTPPTVSSSSRLPPTVSSSSRLPPKTPPSTSSVSSSSRLPPMTSPTVSHTTSPAVKQPKEIVLKHVQGETAERVQEIMSRDYGYIDTSELGAGKTILALEMAIRFRLHLVIVCPKMAESVWRAHALDYGLKIMEIQSFQGLSSTEGHQPKHGMLTRIKGKYGTIFEPTPGYLDWVKKGILLIIDEVHHIKNGGIWWYACYALMRPIWEGGGGSRYDLISGSPIDRGNKQIGLLFRLLGYSTSKYIQEPISQGEIYEIIERCKKINVERTEEIVYEYNLNRESPDELFLHLYEDVVREHISVSMTVPESSVMARKDVLNGFYNLSREQQKKLQLALRELEETTEEGRKWAKGEQLAQRTSALQNIENAKTEAFIRLARETLLANPSNKVVIALSYLESNSIISTALREFTPMVLTGSVPTKVRDEIVNLFQTDPHYRLIVMTTAVGAESISLDDRVGNSQRFMFISPSYTMLNIAQATGRIYRPSTTRSDAICRVVYIKGYDVELKIYERLNSRGSITERVIGRTQNKLTKKDQPAQFLPSEFGTYTEPEE